MLLQSQPDVTAFVHNNIIMYLPTTYYHDRFEWANQIYHKVDDKSLIKPTGQIQGCMAHGRSW